ncbi:MAG: hypothetical protein FJ033_12820 [Chloroflexi bacterium]|nr:hypothetical protein [Chloroflexota bacterium]
MASRLTPMASFATDSVASVPGGRIGEVIATTTEAFSAQCHALDEAPPFASFVRTDVDGVIVLAVVARVTTGPIDGSRRVIARGAEHTDASEVWTSNPELELLLRTEFEARILGYLENDRAWLQYPPRPPRLHSFVYTASSAQIAALGEDPSFVRPLADATARSDQLIGAAIRRVADASGDQRTYLLRAGRMLAPLIEHDISRLRAILGYATQ